MSGLSLPPGAVPLPVGAVDLVKALDEKTGAPTHVRAAVGAAETDADRLATLRKFYPTAQPYDGDNFVFVDPKTGRPTLYNEKNPRFLGVPIPTAGDIASLSPEAAELAGGAVGGAAALAAGAASGGLGAAAIPAGVGLGAAAGRELAGRIAQMTAGTVDSRGIGERLGHAAVTAGVNAAASRLPEWIGGGLRKIFGGGDVAAQGAAAGALQDFAAAGVPVPTAGAVSGNRGMQIIENGLSNTPGGASVMQGRAAAALAGMDRAADAVAERLAGGGGQTTAPAHVPSFEQAGEILTTGAKNAGARFATRARDLGNDLYAKVGGERVEGAAVADLARGYLDKIEADPGLASTYKRLTDELGDVVRGAGPPAAGEPPRGISFDALHRLRRKVGEALDNPDVSNYRGVAQSDLEAYYGALTRDMQDAAAQAGPEAEKALALHDRYIRYNQNINMPALNRVDRAATPEAALRLALGGAKDGGTRLAQLRRNLKPEEWDGVAAGVWDRLGRARPGAAGAAEMGEGTEDFSVATFMTNWNRLSPGAQRALFGGSRYADIVPDMNALVRVGGRLKDAEKMSNPSGTARNLLVGMGAAAVANQAIVHGDPKGAALMAATGVLAPRAAATLLTNPKFVKWLAGAATRTETAPARLPAELMRLGMLVEAEPGLRDAVGQYAAALRPAATAPQGPPARQ